MREMSIKCRFERLHLQQSTVFLSFQHFSLFSASLPHEQSRTENKFQSPTFCNMFEATFEEGDVFKKLIAAIGDLVKDANLDCSEEGIRLQAMDSSHVSLVNLFLSTQSFAAFECDHNHTLGINFAALNKLLKCSKPKDSITMRHDDDSDTLQFVFTDESMFHLYILYICESLHFFFEIYRQRKNAQF